MKQNLKFALVIFIIITLLGPNTAVLAKTAYDEVTSEKVTNSVEVTQDTQNGNTVEPINTTTENSNQTVNQTQTNTTTNATTETVTETQPQNAQKAQTPETSTIGLGTEQNGLAKIDNPIPATDKGTLELTIDFRFPQQTISANELKVTLTKAGQTTPESVNATTGEEKDKELFYTFKNLEPGQYNLKITGNRFQTFTQSSIKIDPNITTQLNLVNGYDGLAAYSPENDGTTEEQESQKGKIGVIGLGDVTGDGNIRDDDTKAIIDKIESKAPASANDIYDLNKDGKIDIVDLSYAAINKNHSFIGAPATWIATVNPESVTSSIGESKLVENSQDSTIGTISDLFTNNDKHISIQPPKDEPISITNPIKLEMEITQEIAETQIVTIAPSSNPDHNITQGTIVVETIDGEQKTFTIGNQPSGGTETGKIKSLYKVASLPSVISDSTRSIKVAEATSDGNVTISDDGTIVLDFGNAIVVKKVTINVTGTTSNELADISRVEFFNGMENKIPEPDLNIPTLRTDDIDKLVTEEHFTVKWNNEPNVTGYQVRITSYTSEGEEIEDFNVDGHEIKIEKFKGKDIKDLLDKGKGKDPSEKYNYKNDYTAYHIKVRSVNGKWYSPYSEEYVIMPTPNGKPNAPTGLTLKGGYQSMSVKWNGDPRATTYMVEYKKANSDEEYKKFTKIDPTTKKETTEISETSCVITGLASEVTEYSVRVYACNKSGVSDPSQTATASTLAVQEVSLPTYKRINTSNGPGKLSAHINDITFNSNVDRYMVDSPLDTTPKSAQGVADNNFGSYLNVNDWDWGGYYAGSDKGVQVKFDKVYTMNYVTVAKVEWNTDFAHARVWYKERANGATGNNLIKMDASQVVTRQDETGAKYTVVKLAKPITTDEIVVSLGNSDQGKREIKIAEMGFYEYDDIETKINDLFEDAMHLKLNPKLTKDQIKANIAEYKETLNAGIQKVGGAEGERDYHIDKENLLDELNTAQTLLDNGDLGKITKINSQIATSYDSGIEFRDGLSALQPLGVMGRTGEEITVYVGNPYLNVGDGTRLQLVATQWRAEGEYKKVVKNLQVGANKITVPDMISTSREKGGSLYIQYTGLEDDKPTRYIDRNYAVRVSGGTEIPVLDLSSKEDPETGNVIPMSEDDKKAAVKTYIDEITDVVSTLEEKHNGDVCKDYRGADEYKLQDCLLGITEIVLDQMMYSVSSKQIYDGITEKIKESGRKDLTEADALYKSLVAMDQMMDLFYSQKGLIKRGQAQNTNAYGNNTYPRTRQNIRCMRMTGRAFMYAGSGHIGIQWNEVKLLSKGAPMKVDTTGKETSDSNGNYFGWGIAHEIGHIINQQAYVQGEVTNNYFSILAQTDNTRNTVRFNYDDVYAKVTSDKKGKAQNVFTQLGLYWQLHLAYDKGGYNYKQYTTQQDLLNNAIYARMDTYARNPSKAPSPKGIALKIVKGDTDNNLMKLACAATQKDILTFFEKWGMEPSQETIEYAAQWDKETRAIWYVNDEARNYELEGGEALPTTAVLDASITNAPNNRTEDNEVTFALNVSGAGVDANGVLGYEIIRSYMSNNNVISRPVAFVEPSKNEDGTTNPNITYTDRIDTINNRAFTYTIVAYDKCLNEIAKKELNPIKVTHQGQISQDGWEITTNMTSSDDKKTEDLEEKDKNNVEYSDEEQTISSVPVIADGKMGTTFNGTTTDDKAQITIKLPETKKLVGLKYYGQKFSGYKVEVKTEGKEWTTVREGKNEAQSEANPVSRAINSIRNFFVNLVSAENEVQTDTQSTDSQVLEFTKVIDGKQTVYNYDYDCDYVRITIDDQNVSISEIDLLAQSGDNVEFNEVGSIAKLKEDFIYAEGNKVPKDSIVLTGTYKGNPAYNVAKVWYQDAESGQWRLINGYQLILAPHPGEGNLGETSEGKWIFVLEPEGNPDYSVINSALGKGKIRVELYRVDNAKTNVGERLVSDTLIKTIPSEFADIQFKIDGSN